MDTKKYRTTALFRKEEVPAAPEERYLIVLGMELGEQYGVREIDYRGGDFAVVVSDSFIPSSEVEVGDGPREHWAMYPTQVPPRSVRSDGSGPCFDFEPGDGSGGWG